MKKNNFSIQLIILLNAFLFFVSQHSFAQETVQDSVQWVKKGNLQLDDIDKIIKLYRYDAETDRYIYTVQIDEFDMQHPLVLTRKEYEDLLLKITMRDYYSKKVAAVEGKLSEEEQKDLLPQYYVNSKLFETIFGSNTIDIKPMGQVETDLGIRYTKQDNPIISPRNRRVFALDFKPRISMGLKGKVGTNMDVNINYDTQAMFGFQQQLAKLQYKPGEDDILQALEVGNVSMPVNNSLVRGAQNLFGIKSQLQFGRTHITGVMARQQSQRNTIVTEGGGLVQNFELFALDYERDRHFFLSQYFRNNYDKALRRYPYIDSRVRINRVEVWVTNRQNRIATTNNNMRNIIAIQDLGEGRSSTIDAEKLVGVDLNNHPDFFVNKTLDAPADNTNNKFNPEEMGTNYLNEQVRQINSAIAGFNIPVTEGRDFAKLENARKLTESEFKFHPQLGYISLQQPLANDEVLAVAFEYTIGDKIYKVGEFGTDGVDATVVGQDQNNMDIPTTQGLVLKMLKSSLTATEEPVWNLMMKNIYKINGNQISQEGFRFNILYTDPQPLNYIEPVGGTPLPDDVKETTLLRVFHLDRLNNTNDPQIDGDGYFDYIANAQTNTNGGLDNNFNNQGQGNAYFDNQQQRNNNRFEGITIDEQNGRIIFTTVEPFGEYLFKKLSVNGTEDYESEATYNENQLKYVYKSLYRQSYAKALQDTEKNKFQLKGKYRSSRGDGIYVGSSNLQPGSVIVTAGGRTLAEGMDYTVDYQRGFVTIIDPSLQNSDTPVEISVESNQSFSMQRRNFYGVHVDHKFSDDFIIGATYLTLNEVPFTNKSMYDQTSVNNSIYGFNFNFSKEAPFLTRWVNKLPNIDTDAPSRISLKGEFAYLKPGASKYDQLNNEPTVYIDNFETTQVNIDMLSPLSWKHTSVPVGYGEHFSTNQSGYRRAKLAWYSIDNVFYSPTLRPDGINETHLASNRTRRIYKSELYPNMDVAQGESLVVHTLNLSYFPKERGMYNYNPAFLANNELPNPENNWGGIMRSVSTTNFENANIEYIEFWLMDPYTGNEGDHISPNNTGKLFFNLGYISEDILQDGFKQYENGLPGANTNSPTISTIWGKVPASTALIYAFDNDGANRVFQDAGLDGILDNEEGTKFPEFAHLSDPAADNYEYFLNTSGDIVTRYKNYNGLEGNNPIEFSDTNRGNNTYPDVEDIDNDNTMNTINAYFQYEVPIHSNPIIGQNYVVDIQTTTQTLNTGETVPVKWIQYKIPISTESQYAVGAISDLQSVRFMRMFLTGFSDEVTLRFGSLNLVRSDWRRYTQSLADNPINQPIDTNTGFDVTTLNIINNATRQPIPYVLPPGLRREVINQNNTLINQNEQALSLRVYRQSETAGGNNGLQPGDSRAVFKNFDFDMREYKKMRMFVHAEALEDVNHSDRLQDNEMVAFIRFGNDFTSNYYQIEYPLKTTDWRTNLPDLIWPEANEMELRLELLNKIKLQRNTDPNQDPNAIYFKTETELDPSTLSLNPLTIGIKGNPNFGRVRTVMLGIKNNTDVLYANTAQQPRDIRGEVWFNELRMSDLDEKGGWAAQAVMDAQIADFALVTASVNKSTIGFGSLEQMPQERSREDVFSYNVTTAVNTHQLLPKNWRLNIPMSYSVSEEKITPEYDPNNPDLRLKDVRDFAGTKAEKDAILDRAIEYTKRSSINFIGVRKDRAPEQKARFYDIENFTVSQSFNQVEQRNFEIESYLDQQARTTVDYAFAFKPFSVEPFKKVSNNRYLKWLTDVNINPLPSAVNFNTNIIRQFNQQKYRMVDVQGIEIQPLFRRNYFFNYAYGFNMDLTKSIKVDYRVSNVNIVRNYFLNDGRVNNELGIWDGYFDIGNPNNRMQQFTLNYELPFSKFPFLAFIKSNYSYTGDYSWTRASLAMSEIDYNGVSYNLGNTIQNANTHRLNTTLSMDKLYSFLGLVPNANKPKKKTVTTAPKPGQKIENKNQKSDKDSKEKEEKENSPFVDGIVKVVTGVKNVGINYNETNGTVLPGFLPGLGFFGSAKPTLGFVLGEQRDIRYEAAKRGWLTSYPEFNQVYQQVHTQRLDFTADYKPIKNLTVDFRANRMESYNMSEQYDVTDGAYNSRSSFEYGYFEISTNMLRTAFLPSDVHSSVAFDRFRNNRMIVAERLATEAGIDINNPANRDQYGYPIGYGRTSQEVLIPAFLAAYQGQDVNKTPNGFFRKIPIPGWTLNYRGLTDLAFFRNRFKRVSLQHGYMSSYTIGNYQTNYDFLENPNQLNASGNFPSKIVVNNINMVERFNPLMKLEFETKNDFKFIATLNKHRMLSMSFDNNLLSETSGMDYRFEVGFRIKDVAIQTDFEGVDNNGRIVSDINVKLGVNWQRNHTLIRFLDYENNQVGAGQDIWTINAMADYRFSKNFTGIFYYEHNFSKAVISTMFPVTNIRSGFTLRYSLN